MKIKDLKIKFSYERELKGYDVDSKGKSHPVYSPGGKTLCTIESPNTVVVGESECSEEDIFDKDKGRKIALKRAVEQASLSKQDRIIIWERYRTSTKNPKW